MSEGFDTFQENLGHQELSKQELFEAYLKMQVELARDYLGFEPTDQNFTEWEEKNSEHFGVIVTEHPEFIQEFLKGGEERQEILHKVNGLLNEKREVHA